MEAGSRRRDAIWWLACLVVASLAGDAGAGPAVRAAVAAATGQAWAGRVVAAACDWLAHALVAAFAWMCARAVGVRATSHHAALRQAAAAAAVAALVDTDRFVETLSLRLDASSLLGRQAFWHCLPSICALAAAAHWAGRWRPDAIGRCVGATRHVSEALACIVLVAGLTHTLRDAARRGLWLLPPGNGLRTPPLGVPLSLAAQCGVALAAGLAMRRLGLQRRAAREGSAAPSAEDGV